MTSPASVWVASDARAWFRQDGGIAMERISLGLPARSRTSTTGFVDRCLHPAGQGEIAGRAKAAPSYTTVSRAGIAPAFSA